MNKARIYNVECTKGYMMSEQGKGLSLRPWGNRLGSAYEDYICLVM